MLLDGDLAVVEANPRWRALHLPFREQHNVARMVFLDPAAAAFYADLSREEHDVVAALSEGMRDAGTRRRTERVVDELLSQSGRFDALWRGLPVRLRRADTYVVRHPELGTLSFDRRTARHGGRLLRVAQPHPRTAELVPLLDHLVEPPQPGRATAR